MNNYLEDSRFEGIKPFEKKIWLASPTMHGEELAFVQDAFDKNWITTAGENVNELEKMAAEYLGCKYAVGLSSGTAALHMCAKLAAERIYGTSTGIGDGKGGALRGKKVFCSSMTFDASANPFVYEGAELVFIDSEYDTWNMDPTALEKAFEIYPDTKIVVVVNLYGTPAKLVEIRDICDKHGAVLIEDAAESLGAAVISEVKIKYQFRKTGTFGDYNAISFNGNKIITGSSGGMFLTDSLEDANKVRKWSTQAREAAPWYQHEELGYNYRISNIIAGIARGQWLHLDEHIEAKKRIYERYKEGLKDLPVKMNPYIEDEMNPNFWLSCLIIDEDAMCKQVRGEKEALYESEKGKNCPTEILEALAAFNIEGRPIWKPMHMQPIYRMNPYVTASGIGRARTNAYIDGKADDIGMDIFDRGLCLPSDIKMTEEEQNTAIEIIKRCFE